MTDIEKALEYWLIYRGFMLDSMAEGEDTNGMYARQMPMVDAAINALKEKTCKICVGIKKPNNAWSNKRLINIEKDIQDLKAKLNADLDDGK